MRIKAHQPIEGVNPGATVDVPEGKARWYVANGYASVTDDGDHTYDTSVEAAVDPQLASNRELPKTENVRENAEFKPGTSKNKITPGKRSTAIKASDAAVDEQAKELDRAVGNRATGFDGDVTPEQVAAQGREVEPVEVAEPPTAAESFGKEQPIPVSVQVAEEEAQAAAEKPKAAKSRAKASSSS